MGEFASAAALQLNLEHAPRHRAVWDLGLFFTFLLLFLCTP